MPPTGLTDGLKTFIHQNIHSVTQLETLLLLYGDCNRNWRSDELASAMYLDQSAAEQVVESLANRRLVRKSRRLEASTYCYNCEPSVDRFVSELADCYRTARHRVIQHIFAPD